jgi:hypothetical protein
MEEVYRAFSHLDHQDQQSLAIRILSDKRLLSDLYDHFLIQHGMSEKGESIPWDDYRRVAKPLAS